MRPFDHVVRIVAFAAIALAICGAAGGQLIKRTPLPNGGSFTQTLTLYKTLPPAPVGPSFCDVLGYGSYAMAFPCNFKPPFVDWLQGKRY